MFEAEDCVICQEAFGEAETGYTLPCGHRGFHRECLADWFSISGRNQAAKKTGGHTAYATGRRPLAVARRPRH